MSRLSLHLHVLHMSVSLVAAPSLVSRLRTLCFWPARVKGTQTRRGYAHSPSSCSGKGGRVVVPLLQWPPLVEPFRSKHAPRLELQREKLPLRWRAIVEIASHCLGVCLPFRVLGGVGELLLLALSRYQHLID